MYEIGFPGLILDREIKSSERSHVCLVRNRNTGQRFIYRCFTGSGEVYRRMVDMECPHLPKIYEVKEEYGKAYILEEYIQGDTLAFLLEAGPLPQEYARDITIHICRALQILHGFGAVHRDIKPENVILRGSDAILIDFDASRLCKAESTVDTRIMGTTGYAAPEQYGFSQTDARADIYTVGILLNEMLTGRHPSQVLANEPFRAIVDKCTRINADQRYASAEELIAALTALFQPEETPEVPRPASPLLRLFQREDGRWNLLPAMILALVILAGGGLILNFLLPKEQPVLQLKVPVTEATEPETQPTTAPTEAPTTAPTEETTTPKEEEIIIGRWTGPGEGYATTFYYDLDGDGNNEQYIFGVDFLNSPHPNVVYYEICGMNMPGEKHPRSLFGCVWRVRGGSLEVAEEFTELLTDGKSSLWLLEGPGLPTPPAMYADYKWPGAMTATFFPKETSTWVYKVTAYLNGQELTAWAPFSYVRNETFS